MLRKAIEKALSLNPENAEAYVVMGKLHDRSRDAPQAIVAYEKAIELNPSYSEAYVLLADATMRSGQQDRAWAALDMARSLDPVSPTMLSTVAHRDVSMPTPVCFERIGPPFEIAVLLSRKSDSAKPMTSSWFSQPW